MMMSRKCLLIFSLLFAKAVSQDEATQPPTEAAGTTTVAARIQPPVQGELQELKLEGDCKDIEDCYGYNVGITGCVSGKCLYKASTLTECFDNTTCQIIEFTSCVDNFCTCNEGYGIHKFVMDLCMEIPQVADRWKYEIRRDPAAIAATKPWGEGEEYSVIKQYKVAIYAGLLGFVVAFVVALLCKCLCACVVGQVKKRRKPPKEHDPLTNPPAEGATAAKTLLPSVPPASQAATPSGVYPPSPRETLFADPNADKMDGALSPSHITVSQKVA